MGSYPHRIHKVKGMLVATTVVDTTGKKIVLLRLGEVFQEQGPANSKVLRQERTERKLSFLEQRNLEENMM